MHLKMSSVKWRLLSLVLNELKHQVISIHRAHWEVFFELAMKYMKH